MQGYGFACRTRTSRLPGEQQNFSFHKAVKCTCTANWVMFSPTRTFQCCYCWLYKYKKLQTIAVFFKWKSSLHERFPFMLIIYFLSVPHLVGIPWSENVAVQFSEREFYLHSIPTGLTSLSFLSTLKYLVERCFWFAGSGALRGLWAQWDPELGKKKKERKLLFTNFPCFKSVIEPSKF